MKTQTSEQAEAQTRHMLLQKTLEHVHQRVPAYRKRADNNHRTSATDELQKFPITYKKDLIENPDSYLADGIRTSYIQHTGGTTYEHILIHRSNEEIEFWKLHKKALAEQSQTESVRFIQLHVETLPHHGTRIGDGLHTNMFILNLSDWIWRQRLPEIVSSPWLYACCDPAGVLLTGPEADLRLLTALLIERNYDFRRSPIKALVATGDLVTNFRRRWYTRTWDAPLLDRFSMSEVNAGADICTKCGCFHFEPSIYPEVVDLNTRKPIDRGVGVLVLTTLYPFVQRMPLIRYYTDDIVDASQCERGGLGFKILGRRKDCLLDVKDGRTKLLISSAIIADIMESSPEVAISTDESKGLWDSRLVGHPLCAARRDGSHIIVEFSPSYVPHVHQAKDSRTREKLRSEILRRHPDLMDELKNGRLSLDVKSSPRPLTSVLRPGMLP